MKAWKANTLALLGAFALTTPALAASPVVQADATGQDQTTNATTASLRQQIANDLAKSGFTDVKIMPQSFLIRAKDSKGDPVMMVINPDSLTAMTEIAAPANGSSKMSGASANNANGEKVLSGANANGDPTPPAKQ